jgi:hypothetical protein
MKATENLSITKLNTKRTNNSTHVEFISQTNNFEDLHHVNGVNRKPIESNILNIIDSFERLGSGSARAVIIETKVFGGVKRIIADGQHTVQASIRSGFPINLEVVKLKEDTNENLIKYISALNNVKVGWSNQTYINQFSTTKYEYQKFGKHQKDFKLTITDLLYIFLGGGGAKENKSFKSGDMVFSNEAKSNDLMKLVVNCKSMIPNKAAVRRGFIKQAIKFDNNAKLELAITKFSGTFSDDEKTFAKQISTIIKKIK